MTRFNREHAVKRREIPAARREETVSQGPQQGRSKMQEQGAVDASSSFFPTRQQFSATCGFASAARNAGLLSCSRKKRHRGYSRKQAYSGRCLRCGGGGAAEPNTA